MDYYSTVNLNNWLWIIVLVAARFLGAMLLCPIFSEVYFSKILKFVVALLFALIVFPYFTQYIQLANLSLFARMTLLVKELLFGCLLGYLLALPIFLLESVGNIIDMQRGEQFGAIVSNVTKTPSSSLGKLLMQGFITYLIAFNWLLFFCQVMFGSFRMVAINNFFPQNPVTNLQSYISFFAGYCYWFVVLSLPIIFAMFLLDFVVGLVSAFIPQLNATMLTMPLKSALAMFLLIFYIGGLYHVVVNHFVHMIKILGFSF